MIPRNLNPAGVNGGARVLSSKRLATADCKNSIPEAPDNQKSLTGEGRVISPGKCGEMAMTRDSLPVLRPYQETAVEAVRDAYRAGAARALLVSPTGSGKTIMFGYLVHSATVKQKRVLILAHRIRDHRTDRGSALFVRRFVWTYRARRGTNGPQCANRQRRDIGSASRRLARPLRFGCG